MNFKSQILKNKEYEFIAFFNSRNIRRKHPSDLIIGFSQFVKQLPKQKQDKAILIMKTAPVDNNGTDLITLHRDIAPDIQFIIIPNALNSTEMNYLYNMADVTLQPSSAEGFGLSIAESLAAGTPIIASCIGGLQDQMGFRDENGKLMELNIEHPTNSDMKYTEHGEWAFPLTPQLNMVGSPPTPYIYDSSVSISEITKALIEVNNLD